MNRIERDNLVSKLADYDAEMYEIHAENRAIQQLHRMFQLVLALLEQHQSVPAVDEMTAERLMDGFRDFYNSYVTTWERNWTRAGDVWWALLESMLHTIGDDFDTLFGLWFTLRWISFSKQKRDFRETDQLIRLMLNETFGPDLLECYYEDDEDLDHQLDDLREAACHYLEQTTGPNQLERFDRFIQSMRTEND